MNLKKATAPAAMPIAQPVVVLPDTGEALISMATFASVLEIAQSTAWDWAREDPDFPPLVRRGERFTRMRLSDARRFIEGLRAGVPKAKPGTAPPVGGPPA